MAPERTIVIGNDSSMIKQVVEEIDARPAGYLSPTVYAVAGVDEGSAGIVAGGGAGEQTNLSRLGGLSRIEDVLVNYDVDTAILAFAETDRAEFFGVLDACYEHGVNAKVHRDYADTVLTADRSMVSLVDVEIEPWDVQDYSLKRGFDVAFSLVGLVVLSPVMLGIVVAIKLEDGGSILYSQDRTAVFGETFDIYKFRSMVENAESETGATISDEDEGGVDPRVTRVGGVLRQTHLDEIPQLWSVLRGDMSVVGPRPERPALDTDIQTDVANWQKRWFVKPGLTGPAQINDITGAEPELKLRYDLKYVRDQSFQYDLKIVSRQIWKVLTDVVEHIESSES
jgi:lipopolysaccharide/colanic/teichoic acid biosynthesis glycosyltransferase